ncbi:hypothetical protein L9F63_014296, partial [Diploptera punctata]
NNVFRTTIEGYEEQSSFNPENTPALLVTQKHIRVFRLCYPHQHQLLRYRRIRGTSCTLLTSQLEYVYRSYVFTKYKYIIMRYDLSAIATFEFNIDNLSTRTMTSYNKYHTICKLNNSKYFFINYKSHFRPPKMFQIVSINVMHCGNRIGIFYTSDLCLNSFSVDTT